MIHRRSTAWLRWDHVEFREYARSVSDYGEKVNQNDAGGHTVRTVRQAEVRQNSQPLNNPALDLTTEEYGDGGQFEKYVHGQSGPCVEDAQSQLDDIISSIEAGLHE